VSAVLPLVVLAAMVAVAALALLVGPDDRPGIDVPPDGWIGTRG
jgi:hypothetical protein